MLERIKRYREEKESYENRIKNLKIDLKKTVQQILNENEILDAHYLKKVTDRSQENISQLEDEKHKLAMLIHELEEIYYG